jgi:hypothetical protein
VAVKDIAVKKYVVKLSAEEREHLDGYCLKAGADAAWATDRGEPIVPAMIANLRANNVLLPAVTVLERIGLAARARARKKVFEVLADGLAVAERDALEKLLAVDSELRRSRFAWLRDYSASPAPSNIVTISDRLEYARGLGIDHKPAGRIHPDRLNRLVNEGTIMTMRHMADLEPARRIAMLVAQAAALCADQVSRTTSAGDGAEGPRNPGRSAHPTGQRAPRPRRRVRCDRREGDQPGRLVAGGDRGRDHDPARGQGNARLLGQEIEHLNTCLKEIETKLTAMHKANAISQLLATIPEIGPIIALTLAIEVDPSAFESGRHLAAWIG